MKQLTIVFNKIIVQGEPNSRQNKLHLKTAAPRAGRLAQLVNSIQSQQYVNCTYKKTTTKKQHFYYYKPLYYNYSLFVVSFFTQKPRMQARRPCTEPI